MLVQVGAARRRTRSRPASPTRVGSRGGFDVGDGILPAAPHDHHRHQGEREHQRAADREHHREREVAEERRREALHEDDRPEDEQRGERAGDQRPGDLVGRLDRRLVRGVARLLAFASRRVGDDDRVVHQQAHPEREPAEREHVHRHVEELQEDERDQHREREDRRDREARPPVA